LGGLWALEWAWLCTETNLRCVRSSGICSPNLNSVALIVSEISAFIRTDRRTDGQTDMARSTRLVILIKNIYTLWGRKRFLLPVTYFPTNLVYPFTLRVTGIKTNNRDINHFKITVQTIWKKIHGKIDLTIFLQFSLPDR